MPVLNVIGEVKNARPCFELYSWQGPGRSVPHSAKPSSRRKAQMRLILPPHLIGTIGDVRFGFLWPSQPLFEKVWGESHTGRKVNLAANVSVLNLTRAEGGEECKAMF